MKIIFRKQQVDPASGILFTWMLAIQPDSSVTLSDHFIPELFFDYFFVKEGSVRCIDQTQQDGVVLPAQVLKTLFTRPIRFVFTTPLVLFGARLALGFAESFWGEIKANCFLRQAWVRDEAVELGSFTSQLMETVQKHRARKLPYPLLSPELEESGWLVHFSPRHKRRLYKQTFGLSRKELQNIRKVHSFLEQTCDFGSQNPRIIQHVNAEVFYDQPHLNHTFKKMTGLSPVEYFETNSILQDNLMAASYNENPDEMDKI
jgi:AraC-like DNA-binding protein